MTFSGKWHGCHFRKCQNFLFQVDGSRSTDSHMSSGGTPKKSVGQLGRQDVGHLDRQHREGSVGIAVAVAHERRD